MSILEHDTNAVNGLSETEAAKVAPDVQPEETEPFESAAEIFGPNDTEESLQVPAPDFAADDLECFGRERYTDAPQLFTRAVRGLVELAQSAPEFGPYSDYGRFDLCNAPKVMADVRAGFRLCHSALDFLEADYRACEEEEIDLRRKQFLEMLALTVKTDEERVADAYWQAMEVLNAAGLDFDALVSYHEEQDGEEDDDNR